MKRLFILLLSVISMSVAGCTNRSRFQDLPQCRVVTEIVIETKNVTRPGQCRYTAPDKLTKALNYLRRLDPWDLPKMDPEAAPGARYHITLRFSDGSQKTYDQIGYDYLREADGPWREIAPEYALRLPLLLAAVPTDTI